MISDWIFKLTFPNRRKMYINNLKKINNNQTFNFEKKKTVFFLSFSLFFKSFLFSFFRGNTGWFSSFSRSRWKIKKENSFQFSQSHTKLSSTRGKLIYRLIPTPGSNAGRESYSMKAGKRQLGLDLLVPKNWKSKVRYEIWLCTWLLFGFWIQQPSDKKSFFWSNS